MKWLEKLRGYNRTLLEMYIGMLFFGLACGLIGLIFADSALIYSVSLWLGVILAVIGTYHMWWVLDRAMDRGSKAQMTVFLGYLLRYGVLVAVMIVIIVTDVLNPLITFLGYMSIKAAAFMQPFSHKLCNRIFHETDPVPEPMPYEDDEEDSEEE